MEIPANIIEGYAAPIYTNATGNDPKSRLRLVIRLRSWRNSTV